MSVSVDALRACGERYVTLVTRDGAFAGRIDQARLSDRAVVAMLVPPHPASEPLVIALDAVAEIVER
ncbi:MAG: hypothetical protein NVSMB19_15150 [Vulcanimicrobiaceae bacterium]